MDLAKLDDAERLALVGLAKLIVRADHTLTEAEALGLDALAEATGPEAFMASLKEAAATLRTRADAMKAAEAVTRAEAQRAIYEALLQLADSDGVAAEERKVLEWLAKAWTL